MREISCGARLQAERDLAGPQAHQTVQFRFREGEPLAQGAARPLLDLPAAALQPVRNGALGDVVGGGDAGLAPARHVEQALVERPIFAAEGVDGIAKRGREERAVARAQVAKLWIRHQEPGAHLLHV